MLRKSIRTTLLVLLAASVCLAASFVVGVPTILAQVQTSKRTFRVAFEVDADGGIKDELASFIARELRSLNDVVIVRDAPEYRLSVVALPSQSVSGDIRGYVASVTAAVPINNYAPKEIVQSICGELSDEQWKDVSWVFEGQEETVHHVLYVGSPTTKDLAERIVAGFDQNVVEKRRQMWQRMEDRAKRKAGA
jgi:hypothetical protein